MWLVSNYAIIIMNWWTPLIISKINVIDNKKNQEAKSQRRESIYEVFFGAEITVKVREIQGWLYSNILEARCCASKQHRVFLSRKIKQMTFNFRGTAFKTCRRLCSPGDAKSKSSWTAYPEKSKSQRNCLGNVLITDCCVADGSRT